MAPFSAIPQSAGRARGRQNETRFADDIDLRIRGASFGPLGIVGMDVQRDEEAPNGARLDRLLSVVDQSALDPGAGRVQARLEDRQPLPVL